MPERADHRRDRLPDHPRRPRRARAALRQRLPPRRARPQDLPARGPLGGVPRPRARARPLLPRGRGHPRRDRAAEARGHQRRDRRRRAARAVGSHRLRGRPPLPRPAPGARGRGPGAARALHPARRDQPAPPLRAGPALGRDPQRPRRDGRPRPRRRRRLPVRDGRGRADGRLPERRGQPRHRAAQGHREGHLHDRHPRGARLRAPVRVHRPQAGAHRDLRHPRLLRLGARAAPAWPSWTATATSAMRILAGRRGVQAGPAPSTSTRRSTRRRWRRPTARRPTRTTPQKVRELELEQPVSLRHILDLQLRPRAAAGRAGRRRGGPPQLPDRDLLDELRLAGRDRLPRLRRGGQADQHRRHERRGRRDPRHVREVPALARPAGGLRPLRRHQRDGQLLVPRGDQDRPGREARRGRPPAGQEGHREGGRRPATPPPAPT